MPVYQDLSESIRENGKPDLAGLDGSSDGFPLVFHVSRDAHCYRMIVNALFEICQGNDHKADEVFEKLLMVHQPFEMIADIIRAVNSYRDDLSCRSLNGYILKKLLESEDAAMIKIALVIASGYLKCPSELKDVIRTLACLPEFSWYCFRIISLWPDGEREIVEAIDKKSFWSIVHAIYFLDASKPENLKFVLSLLGEKPEAAILCAEHICRLADFETVLTDDPDEREVLTVGMLMELFCQLNNVHELPGFEKNISLIIKYAEKHDCSIMIMEFLAEMTVNGIISKALQKKCLRIIKRSETLDKLMSDPFGWQFASLNGILGISFDETIIERLKNGSDPVELIFYIQKPSNMQKALESISTEGLHETDICFILSALRLFPWTGISFLDECLNMKPEVQKAVLELIETWMKQEYRRDEKTAEMLEKHLDEGLSGSIGKSARDILCLMIPGKKNTLN
ncbi:MAG: hypothetical protein IJM15_07990 [Erysipelotrichaceae bacterium]|nr:hypothetical protein [Erysipelotrichaceae bacterium]